MRVLKHILTKYMYMQRCVLTKCVFLKTYRIKYAYIQRYIYILYKNMQRRILPKYVFTKTLRT